MNCNNINCDGYCIDCSYGHTMEEDCKNCRYTNEYLINDVLYDDILYIICWKCKKNIKIIDDANDILQSKKFKIKFKL